MPNKRGIVITVPKKYEEITLLNIQGIRKMGCQLPIELWEIGKEISEKTKNEFSNIEGITFKNVEDYSDNPQHWKGFQVKVFAFFYSSFQEVFLCDADVLLHQNPTTLFEDEHYIETGTYFFRDLEKWQFSKLRNPLTQFYRLIIANKFESVSFFKKRKDWLTTLLPEKKANFPKEWDYIYDSEIPKKPVKEALQESGVVVMNREKQKESFQCIFNLNNRHKETYQYIWGDKETFWIGCLIANKEYYFNPSAGYMAEESGRLTHDYKDEKFFSQKG